MPIYAYECPDCGHEAEDIRKYEERNDPLECEKCGGAMEPRIAATAIQMNPYDAGLIMHNGQKVRGHMGKTAPNKRRKGRGGWK